MTYKIGPKGQVVIPKNERERLGIVPGSEVVFESVEDGVIIRPRGSIGHMRGMFENTGMAKRLLEDRAQEPR